MSLWKKILIGLIAGVLVGVTFGERAAVLQPLGTVFINLIMMIVIPLIFFVITNGVASLKSVKGIARISVKSVMAFLGTATFAAALGMLVSSIFKPGLGVNLELATKAVANVAMPAVNINGHKLGDILISLVPSNALKSMVEANIFHVIIFAFFTGFALNNMRDRCQTMHKFVEEASHLMIKMISMIIQFAPIGVFGYMSWAIGTQGVEILWALSKLVFCVIGTCCLQYIIFGLIILFFGKMSPLPFYRKVVEPQVLAFSTGCSKATMPTLMNTLQNKLGVSKENTNFLIPLASALNMDGGAIYLGSCIVFFAQATGIVLTPQDYLVALVTCTLGSVGAAGIPSGILLFLGMALTAVGLPVEAVAIIAGVDRILDMVTTMLNVTGNACLTTVIDKTENTLNLEQYYSEDFVTEHNRKEKAVLAGKA